MECVLLIPPFTQYPKSNSHSAFNIPSHPSIKQPREGMLVGIYGYASISVHMAWRETSEHAQAGEIFGELKRHGIVVEPETSVYGIDANTGYFHVKFHSD
jgi:hypothetical protein